MKERERERERGLINDTSLPLRAGNVTQEKKSDLFWVP